MIYNYTYNKGKKFPHVVSVRAYGFDILHMNKWLREECGLYRDFWFRPNGPRHVESLDSANCSLYAFKTLEDATAFKLRWM